MLIQPSACSAAAQLARLEGIIPSPPNSLPLLPRDAGILSDALNFPKKCGELVNKWAKQEGVTAGRALDIGCAVGGSTFEMGRMFGEVVGFDISNTFVDAANEMKEKKRKGYKLKVEGEIVEELMATVDDTIDSQRLTFVQASCCPHRWCTLACTAFACMLARAHRTDSNLKCTLRYCHGPSLPAGMLLA